MSAHICIPALGAAPATINAKSLAIARELGFDGVMITDALDMAAIRATVGTGPGAVAALRTGADLLCVGNPTFNVPRAGGRADEGDFREPLEAIYTALKSGELPVALVEEAAARVAGPPRGGGISRRPASSASSTAPLSPNALQRFSATYASAGTFWSSTRVRDTLSPLAMFRTTSRWRCERSHKLTGSHGAV